MRVLVVSNKCPPDYDGGYELSAFQVASALRDRGHEVTLVASQYRPSFTGARIDPTWVARIFDYREFEPIDGVGAVRAWRNAKRIGWMTDIGRTNAAKLADFLRGKSFDLAYCFGLHGIGLATAHAIKEACIPTLWHAGNYLIADDLELRGLWKRRRLANRIGIRLFSGEAFRKILDGDYQNIAFLSEHVRERFKRQGVVPKRSFIIPRGIEFPVADPDNRTVTQPPTFLFAARIAEEKGVSIALEAAKILLARHDTPWELHLAGPGRADYLQQVRSKISESNLAERVRMLGMLDREGVLDKMRTSAAVLSTSIWEEPFGRTNIEALACGAPLIAADTGAIREIVGDSECAILYPKHNPESLADAMHTILAKPDTASDLSRRGVARIRAAYTMDRVLDLTEAAFREVVA